MTSRCLGIVTHHSISSVDIGKLLCLRFLQHTDSLDTNLIGAEGAQEFAVALRANTCLTTLL
jgi:hypothetical protein